MLQQHYDAKMASVEDSCERRLYARSQDIQSLAAREAALRNQLEAKMNEWKKGPPGLKVTSEKQGIRASFTQQVPFYIIL